MKEKATEHARIALANIAAILERATLVELRNAIKTAENNGQSSDIFWSEINRRLTDK